jgi:spermidine dehydrogenase
MVKMKKSDKELGMDQAITRRDVMHGIGAIGASFALPASLLGCSEVTREASEYYPPSLMGMRGSHDGSFEVAHALAREGKSDWGPAVEPDVGICALVVVGGGISGLCAAHFYRKEKPDAKILILDNHDDFGGHAKRNEFNVDGKTLVIHGGSETMAYPADYSDVVKGMLDDLGVDIDRFETAYDQQFYRRHGLRAGVHFAKEKWGDDSFVPFNLGTFKSFIVSAESNLSPEEAVAQMPISDDAKQQMTRLLTTTEDQIPHIVAEDKGKYLASISYSDFLSKHLEIDAPEIIDVFQDLSEIGVGPDSMSALEGIYYANWPGQAAAGLPFVEPWGESYIHHFPDGNASIARLLVRAMIPGVAPGNSMEDIVSARFDYSKLDVDDSPVRLRLNSTVVRTEHDGEHQSAESVNVSYVRDGQVYKIRARSCVLACYNAVIPHICPAIPQPQKDALALQVKSPILITNVALRNWKPWKTLGIAAADCPGSYHSGVCLNYPVSLGDYEFASGPDEPVTAYMMKFPHPENTGLSMREQFRLGRYELLSTPFEDIERNVRSQLDSLLGAGGFDPANDILGITVNRWSHGYSYSYNPLFDDVYADYALGALSDERYPHIAARKPFGRISIANSDAGAMAMMEVAVEQGHRAATEVLSL